MRKVIIGLLAAITLGVLSIIGDVGLAPSSHSHAPAAITYVNPGGVNLPAQASSGMRHRRHHYPIVNPGGPIILSYSATCDAGHGAPGGFGPGSANYYFGPLGDPGFGQEQGRVTGLANSDYAAACNSALTS